MESNETMDTTSQLSDIGSEVKHLRTTVDGLKNMITHQSKEINDIHRILLTFGGGQFRSSFLQQNKKEVTKPQVNQVKTDPVPRQRKLSHSNLAGAKSFSSLTSDCFNTKDEESKIDNESRTLSPSRSSPAFNTSNNFLANPGQYLDVSVDSKKEGLSKRRRHASFCHPNNDGEEETLGRTRSRSVGNLSAAKSAAVHSRVVTKDNKSVEKQKEKIESTKKLSCESGIDLHEELVINTDDEAECCDIVVPVPTCNADNNQEFTQDKNVDGVAIQPDITTGKQKLVNANNPITIKVSPLLSICAAPEQQTESLLAARIRKVSRDKLAQECGLSENGAIIANDVTAPIENHDKKPSLSTSLPTKCQNIGTMPVEENLSIDTGVQNIDFELDKKIMTVAETKKFGNNDASESEKQIQPRKEESNQPIKNISDDEALCQSSTQPEVRSDVQFSLSNDRVYSCSDLNSASNSPAKAIPNEYKKILRQHSTSSTASADSAPGGIHMKFGHSESDGEETEHEIKILPMPRPSFVHRTVQVKCTNSKYFYEVKEQIGGGRFGRVYRCVEKKTGVQLAAKCFKCKKPHETNGFKARSLSMKKPVTVATKRTDQEPVEKDDVRHEISIMNNIDHDNIIKLYDAFEYENTMMLILEYMNGGEMFERVLADRSQLTELDAILYMRQICKAMQYLHKNLILHLDLKPENILCLDRNSHHIKIIDFGLARKYNPRQKLMVHWGTPEFMAPEVLNYELVSAASDMWSVGVICYILVSGVSPFLGNDDKETVENIIDSEWEFDDDDFEVVSDDAKDFISRLLVEEKRGRMSAAQCLRHDWLSKPLTTNNQACLQSKKQLKKFMARVHWKAGVAAVSAAHWLFNSNKNSSKSSETKTQGTSV